MTYSAFSPQRSTRINQWQLVSTRNVSHWVASSLYSDGVTLQTTYRLRHVVPRGCMGIRLVYTNYTAPASSSITTESDGPNAITVRASVENPAGGNPIPATFNGGYSTTIQPGAIVVSDTIPIEIPDNTTIYTRTQVSVASSGQQWIRGISTINTNGEGNNNSALSAPPAPTLAATTGGSLPNGTYRVAITYTVNSGTGVETLASTSASITLSGSNNAINLSYGVSVPNGAIGRNVYLSTTGGDDTTLKYNYTAIGTNKVTALSTSSTGVPASNNTAGADLTQSTAIVPLVTDYAFGPVGILGIPASPRSRILLVGDSIMTYYFDTTRDTGFMVRAMNNNFPYLTISRPSDRATWFVNDGRRRRFSLLETCGSADVAVCNYGTNDLANSVTLATLQASLTEIWTQLANRGMRVYQCTIVPRTSATYTTDYRDGSGNAVAAASASGTFSGLSAFYPGGLRDQLNTWIKTVPSPLSGVFDIATTVESTTYPGCWSDTSYQSGDGVHPSATGHTLMAAAINTNLF